MREEENSMLCCRDKRKGSSPTVGVLPALREALDDNEEELSALARGAAGGGLALDALGGLNGRTFVKRVNRVAYDKKV